MTDQPRRASYVIHVVSHVRWRRERYLPFQAIRLQLVNLIDALLDLMETDPRYGSFMLDGQAVLLEDYLALRPERFDLIEALVKEGHLQIGPWYIQPDFFLISPEAAIRNLLIGMSTARVFGDVMKIGYMPGAAGQIGQMPQLLRGFGIETAMIMRGLADEPTELTWESPDGSSVKLIYLREHSNLGYDVQRHLPPHLPDVVEAIRRERERLAPYDDSGHLLMLNGGEALLPEAHLPDVIAAAALALPDTLFHSTLPAYIESIRTRRDLLTVHGELRSMARYSLGQGTLSARAWIKQRNHAAETLLTRWVEPFTAWAELQGGSADTQRLRRPQAAIGRAWGLLLENQAQDSLSGTVSDEVCPDITARFDQVTQIGEALTEGALQALAESVDTLTLIGDGAALIVFNPSSTPRTDLIDATFDLPGQFEDGLTIVDQNGKPVYFTVNEPIPAADLARLTLDRAGLQGAQTALGTGRLMGYAIADVYTRRAGDTLYVLLTVSDGEPTRRAMDRLIQLNAELDSQIAAIELRFRRAMTYHIRFVAANLPPLGYAAYGLVLPGHALEAEPRPPYTLAEPGIENAYLRATLDPNGPSITLIDKARGLRYAGLLRLQSEGDRGDVYNFCPVGRAIQINRLLDSEGLIQTREAYAERLQYRVSLVLDPPPEMTPPTAENTSLRIDVELTLLRDVPRLDVQLTVHNTLPNHRIRAHFATPFAADAADYDGHFEVVTRPIQDLPAISPPEGWPETPLSNAPQRAFVAVYAPQPPRDPLSGDESYALARSGLLIANRGLPEADVFLSESGSAEIAITLLRSVSWLHRADLLTRPVPFDTERRAPGAEQIGANTAELSIIPTDSASAGQAHGRAFSEGPFRAALIPLHAGALPQSGSLIRSSSAAFQLSAVKLPNDTARSGLIVRGCNLSGDDVRVTLTPWRPFAYVDVLQLDESETGGRLAAEPDGAVEFKAAAHRILTFWFHDT